MRHFRILEGRKNYYPFFYLLPIPKVVQIVFERRAKAFIYVASDNHCRKNLYAISAPLSLDMTKWKTASHFVSWMGLSPNNKISGGKVLSSKTVKTRNRAKQAFKLAAWGLSNSKSGLAAHYRRLRARIGAPKAINATARKIAVIFYNMLKNKTAYISQSQE